MLAKRGKAVLNSRFSRTLSVALASLKSAVMSLGSPSNAGFRAPSISGSDANESESGETAPTHTEQIISGSGVDLPGGAWAAGLGLSRRGSGTALPVESQLGQISEGHAIDSDATWDRGGQSDQAGTADVGDAPGMPVD